MTKQKFARLRGENIEKVRILAERLHADGVSFADIATNVRDLWPACTAYQVARLLGVAENTRGYVPKQVRRPWNPLTDPIPDFIRAMRERRRA